MYYSKSDNSKRCLRCYEEELLYKNNEIRDEDEIIEIDKQNSINSNSEVPIDDSARNLNIHKSSELNNINTKNNIISNNHF